MRDGTPGPCIHAWRGAERQISQGKTRDFLPTPATSTSTDPDVIGLWIPTPPRPSSRCLKCSSCASGRGFAFSFLPTWPRGKAVAVRLGVPDIKASRGLPPLSHFPARFPLPVIQHQGTSPDASRHAWRTSSSPGESHPRALTEPDLKLSPHPAHPAPVAGRTPSCQWANRFGSRRAIRPNQWVAARSRRRKRRYFQHTHATRARSR